MANYVRKPVIIVGGGLAGSVGALCLRKLGHDVVLFEKTKFPRYQIGESLLPGTLSILTRLGVVDKIKAANFTKKRAATFIWGSGRPPWSFTFSTPKTAPWVYNHAYQVNRAEYDQILLNAAREHGAAVKESHEATDFELALNGEPVRVSWKNCERKGILEADFVIDASGARGLTAKKMKLRRYDEYFRNMAVWSYFKGGKRFKGDLDGNIFSVTFKEGWIWIIPLKEDIYSVGVITDKANNARMREVGQNAFYHECLKMCPLAMDIIETATQCDKVQVVREWAYEATSLSIGGFFLCGDSDCFIDPLFSQGVHLATYSAMLAASAIDYLYQHPEEAPEVHAWYGQSYRQAYNRYHEFLSAFYSCNSEQESDFWSKRKIKDANDSRFEGKDWFTAMTGQNIEAGAEGVEELEERAATLAGLWQHGKKELSDHFDETELSVRRLRWAGQLLKEFKSMATIKWASKEGRLVPSFKIHPTSFKLERQYFIGDENGRKMTTIAITEEHRKLFENLQTNPVSYQVLAEKLKGLGGQATPLQMMGRLVDDGFIQGYDKNGKPVKIRSVLRFGGVGAEDDIS
jgi:flavin-dependent dehydrogenase